MNISDLYPVINRRDYGTAATLEQLLFYCRRSGGEAQIRLGHMSRFIKRSVSAISRYLQWLADQGFIRVRREYRGNACILYVRTLIRLRDHKRDGTADGTARDGHGTARDGILSETQEKLPETDVASGATTLMALKGPVAGAAERVKQKQEVTRARARAKPPAPKAAAHSWVRLLGEYGYLAFDPDDGKHLKHIRKTIGLFGSKTLAEFEAELERRIGLWQNKRPALLKKAPPHPWAINRTDVLFGPEASSELDEALFAQTPDELECNSATPEVDEPNEGDKTTPPVVTMKPSIFGKFLKPKADEDK